MVEASSEGLGSKVARLARGFGLATVGVYRYRAAQGLAVAAMVASLATCWKAGCDSRERATGPPRGDYADPPYGQQHQVREDEPTCTALEVMGQKENRSQNLALGAPGILR